MEGAKNYYVYRDESQSGGFSHQVGYTAENSLLDRGVFPGKVYYYKVKSSVDGKQSEFSSPDSGYSKGLSSNSNKDSQPASQADANGNNQSNNKPTGSNSPTGTIGSGNGNTTIIPIVGVGNIGSGTNNNGSQTQQSNTSVAKDEFEDNDSLSKAKIIRLNMGYNCTLHDTKDVDFYKIYLDGNTQFQISLSKIENGNQYKVELQDFSGNVISSGSSTSGWVDNKFKLVSLGKPGGIYYIKVTLVSGNAGSYVLKVSDVKEQY